MDASMDLAAAAAIYFYPHQNYFWTCRAGA